MSDWTDNYIPPETRGDIDAEFAKPKRAAARARHDGRPLEEPPDAYNPPGAPQPKFTPLASRDELLVSAWLKRELPPRDYLMGEVLCTTSRWLVIGETGVGKTLFDLDFGAAISAASDFLGWKGRRRCRVMYLDGEMPAETFKERVEIIAERYGADMQLFGYNRDVLGPDDMPPLNTEAGRAWLLREIETVKPDLIIFDAIMSLLGGIMSEEESWTPVKKLIREISSKRIAQIWLHHTGHDPTKGFGTKTREWELDTVIMLTKVNSDDGAAQESAVFRLEFTKARLRTPKNFGQFVPRVVRYTENGFLSEDAPAAPKGKSSAEVDTVRRHLIIAYNDMADDANPSAGFDGAPVRKVSVDALRDRLKSRGFLDTNERRQLTATSRSYFRRAKTALLDNKGGFAEDGGLIWKLKP